MDKILQNHLLRRFKRDSSHHAAACQNIDFSGLEIFAYLLFLVYLLQFLSTLLESVSTTVMVNGNSCTGILCLLLGGLGFTR